VAQIFLFVLLLPGRAHAYAWMIRHDYNGCAQCHADPSGGGLLTPYGRAQSEILLRSHYTKWAEDQEPGKTGDFLFGVPLPQSLLLGGDYRGMYMHSSMAGAPSTDKLIQMQADLQGQVTVGKFRVNGSVGYDHNGAEAAWVTDRTQDNLVARVFWAGFDLGEDKDWLVRAGRMNVPFGIRTIEHTLFIHTPVAVPGGGVGDDLNDGQQDGMALAYYGENMRGEAMAILGNYQEYPDAYRKRGYSAYLEWGPSTHYGLGVSSMITQAQNDPVVQTPLIRQAHGMFARFAPWRPLVLMFEQDMLIDSQPADAVPKGTGTLNFGQADVLQADWEPWQGLHLMATGETTRPPIASASWSYGVWGTVNWFFAPHADVRFDAIQQSLSMGPTRTSATTVLVQFHAFL
jgi:hypothetical protein